MMEWSNERMIQFLEVFRTEPCLWDPSEKAYKNRRAHNDAWHRISQSLPFLTTIEDLKKKKDSLMGYYRIHLNKYKNSLKSGTNNVYSTSWFAFDLMDSFLRPIYEGQNTKLPLSPSSPKRNCHSSGEAVNPRIVTPDHTHSQEQKTEPFNCLKSNSSKRRIQDFDEFDYFGLMIAAKIRKINDWNERERLMNSVQNLVFQSIIKINNSHCKVP